MYRTKSLFLAFALSFAVAGCAVDESMTDAPLPPHMNEEGSVDGTPPVTPPVGFAHATTIQRKRILEAALGVDADHAMSETDRLRNGVCPSEEVIDGGVVLRGGCSLDGLHVAGTATITTGSNGAKTYVFDQFDVSRDGAHDTFDGLVRRQSGFGDTSVHADSLLVSRSYAAGDEADHVITTSSGSWSNRGDGRVAAFSWWVPTHPELQMWAGAIGVGRYAVSSASLTLETQSGRVEFKGQPGFAASSEGNGACWSFDTQGVALEQVCDLDSYILLDPR